ncbi:multidrug transporter AcrB [Labilibaculum filiforme]|uniref:Multidrug transporter AcrB n=1 Tax=Labilibaculum filiforme TaxID=1940526 RepID=A0A2N3HUX9_9BACT|nr:CusA/CzcA family heavy metal efflux RND transporter [Labilibaculum filiforme]PKQ61864.1 multidrug transporter AcrB [Labilibaculum filiforme]
MLEKIINFSIRNKLIIILFTLSIALFGSYAILKIPIGAVPDITNNQVQVITTSGNLSTQEIEQFITAPVELEMANLPGVEEIRSISKFGLSVVTIVFNDEIGTYLPRQLIAEKIKSASANIPEGFGSPEMGPITTGLGEIYQYILDVKPGYENRYSAMDLRTTQDWIVKRQLSGIPGVVEVNSWGGFLKQYEVAIDPTRLQYMNLNIMEVYEALQNNNSISGGAYIEKTNQSYFIRGDGQVKSIQDIENIVIKSNQDIPIVIKDIATVHFGYANRFGAITANGQGEKVLGQIMMLKNANSKLVINEVKERVAEIQKNLPEGVFINPILERSELIGKTTTTVVENLLLGCLIVMLIVVLLLGNIRSALVIASMIPLALLFTLSMMYVFGIDANLMSLGALDFGIIIDGAVIIVEYIAIRISAQSDEFNQSNKEDKKTLIDKITFSGASKMMSSAIFGQIIILIVFIPILSLQGVEGKMFRPMALSFSFAIIGAMILGFTWLPVASALFLKPEKKGKWNLSDKIMNLTYRSYTPVMKWSCGHKKIVLGASFAALIFTGVLFSRMGGEFVPTLDEGDFVIQPVLKTGTSLSKTVEICTQMENILIDSFSEVDQIVCRIGAAEVPTDPMSMEEIDMIIKLNPRNEWKVAKNKEELADLFKDALSIIPGIEYEFTQPIEMRFNELITGVRADIAIKIFGEDLTYLNSKANEVKRLIEDVPGAADIIIEKTEGLPQMSVVYKRNKIAHYGLDMHTLNSYLAMAFGGESSGSVFEGEKRFDLVVRLQKEHRIDIENIQQLMIPLPNGSQIPMSELADISFSEGPAKISRENTHRMMSVSVNVRNRDLQSVVKDIQSRIDGTIKLEPGNYIVYGGQFENLQNASKRLLFAVPLALLLIFVFLHFAFGSFKDAIMIFTAVPLSTVGGVLFLWIRGMPFSVSAGIGFIALFGIAVLNGIVLIEHLKDLQEKGTTSMRELILTGTKDRLRPVMLTAAAAAMGFLPMALSTGAGAEVQRPLATVVIGGLITSTMLTMIALPLLFEIFYNVTGIQFRPLRFIRSKSAITGILIAFLSLTATGQTKEVYLEDAIQMAMNNNKQLQAFALSVKQSEALKATAFSIDKTLIYYEYDQNNIAENGHPLQIFGVEQSFSFPSVYTSQLKVNKRNISIAETSYYQKKQMVAKEVSQAYYHILYLENKKNIFLKIDSLYANFKKNANLRFEKGDISQIDLLNAKAKQQQVEIDLLKINHNLKIANQKLNAIIQQDSTYMVPMQELKRIPLENIPIESGSDLQIMKLQCEQQYALLGLERNKLLPDISLGYFRGSNNYAASQTYEGFQIGLAIPLFFGEQKARIKANKITLDITQNMRSDFLIHRKAKQEELRIELMKYEESLQNYEDSGKQLSSEIIRMSEKSYQMGEMNFFQFVVSIENALGLSLNYLDNLSQYNYLALEANYLSK